MSASNIEPLWAIDDVREFLQVKSLTTAYQVAARHDSPRSVRITPGTRRWIPDDWRQWARRKAKGE